MPANVESMFSVREKPWHGLGTIVAEAPDSSAALELAGLDWTVTQKDIATADGGKIIPGFKANVRESDDKVLGIVTDRYKVVQNSEAFAFTDALLGEGVRYETAGSLQGGRRIWLLAKLPQQYIINGDEITPYLVFMNSHDGSGSIKVAMTPQYAESCSFQGEALLELQSHRQCRVEDGRGKSNPVVRGTVHDGTRQGFRKAQPDQAD